MELLYYNPISYTAYKQAFAHSVELLITNLIKSDSMVINQPIGALVFDVAGYTLEN